MLPQGRSRVVFSGKPDPKGRIVTLPVPAYHLLYQLVVCCCRLNQQQFQRFPLPVNFRCPRFTARAAAQKDCVQAHAETLDASHDQHLEHEVD